MLRHVMFEKDDSILEGEIKINKLTLFCVPENHRRMAKILAELANRGIHVILSTNSDYIVKEFNNLLILSKSIMNREELMNMYGYEESQILVAGNVSPYAFVAGKIVPMEIDPEEGIITETFDKVINRQNKAIGAIYFAQYERFG